MAPPSDLLRDATEDVFERRGGGFEPIFVDDNASDTELESGDAAEPTRSHSTRVSLQPEDADAPEAKRPANAGAAVKAGAAPSRDRRGLLLPRWGRPTGSPATRRSRSPSASKMRRKSCCVGSYAFHRSPAGSPNGPGLARTVSCACLNWSRGGPRGNRRHPRHGQYGLERCGCRKGRRRRGTAGWQ